MTSSCSPARWGAGKTAFAQGFGRALGRAEPITSPTFTLVHSYETGGATLHHADLYRLEQLAEVADLALGELAEYDGIVLVEWGDVVEATFGDHLDVRARARSTGDDARRATDHGRRDAAARAAMRLVDVARASGRGPGRSWSRAEARCRAGRC